MKLRRRSRADHPLALRILALALAGWILLWVPGPALAQSVGSWVSPGPLSNDHADLDAVTTCTKCHSPLRGVVPSLCLDCHDDIAEQVSTKKGFHANKGQACATCHPEHRGRNFELAKVALSPLEHLRETGFPLDGAHIRLDCTECHTPGDWGAAEPVCSSCHENPHGAPQKVQTDTCEECHQTRDWTTDELPGFSHTDPKQVDYVLKGAHVDAPCLSCHVKGKFQPIAFDRCTSCHKDPHRADQISNDCESCHDVHAWSVANFDHNLTGYRLEGQHGAVPCAGCHRFAATKALPHETCSDCHADPHRKQFDPRPCDTCHTVSTADFRIPKFDHARTDFPLEGKHGEVGCAKCHGTGPKATYTPKKHADCDACHTDPHEKRFEPTACSACHTPTGWDVGEFDHSRTQFPLRGAHEDVTCEECHPNEKWHGIAHASCLDCHEEQPHGKLFAAATCDDCHVEAAWAEVTFDHAGETEFDLEPQHGATACIQCHPMMDQFAGLDSTCTACHLWDPPARHFEGDCAECHRAAHWRPADLGGRSHDITGWPLQGTHAQLPCADCHESPEWNPLAAGGTTCNDCHADDDSHRNLLGSSCEDCHTPAAWFRTTFRHSLTGWPLRGAHRLAACDDCHASSYVGTPDACWRCHEREAPRNTPEHQSAFFLQCEQCHRPYAWTALPSTGSR